MVFALFHLFLEQNHINSPCTPPKAKKGASTLAPYNSMDSNSGYALAVRNADGTNTCNELNFSK